MMSGLRISGMTLKRLRPRRTTNFNHRYHKYKNLIKNYIPTGPIQLWVSDITYIDTEQKSCFLHLITDAYSLKIVGWCLSETLHDVHTIEALDMAIKSVDGNSLEGLIHHSDRGVQYCCDEYVRIRNEHKVRISMTEDYIPTDNAIAERVNGIIKTEVIYREKRFKDYHEAKTRISNFIDFYNEKRPHRSIGMKCPAEVHQENGKLPRMW